METLQKIIDFIQGQLNSRWYSISIFPYIKKEFNNYRLPTRRGKQANLPNLFQGVWTEILKEEELKTDTRLKDINRETPLGEVLFSIADKHILDKEVKNPSPITLCRGNISNLSLPLLAYLLEVFPSTEPTVRLTLEIGGMAFVLWCEHWDMTYRPKEFDDCWFSLVSKKYSFTDGSFDSVEYLNLNEHYITYTGPSYAGTRVLEGRYAKCLEYTPFGNYSSYKILETVQPFLNKLYTEHFRAVGIKVK